MSRCHLIRARERGASVSFATFAAIAALGALTACNSPVRERAKQPAPGPATHPVTIHQPEFLGAVLVNGTSENPQKLRVACQTCHSLRATAPLPRSTGALKDFHKGLVVQHGGLPCASCHDSKAPQSLRLASGQTVPSAEVMQLCSQCHGTQRRDYDHGAHGGMTGHWDLSRGPRQRKNCVDCHAPHTPTYLGGKPVLPPRDRFLSPNGDSR